MARSLVIIPHAGGALNKGQREHARCIRRVHAHYIRRTQNPLPRNQIQGRCLRLAEDVGPKNSVGWTCLGQVAVCTFRRRRPKLKISFRHLHSNTCMLPIAGPRCRAPLGMLDGPLQPTIWLAGSGNENLNA